MDVKEHGAEGSMSAFILPGIGKDLLSGEDVAWVDSCLVHQADILANNWEAVKDALLDLSGSELNLTSSSTNESDGDLSEMDTGASPSLEWVVTSEQAARRGSDLVLAEIVDFDGDDFPSHEEPSSPIIFMNAFQPNYKEFLEDAFDWNKGLKLGVHEVWLLREEIFKVWALNVPEEEGESFIVNYRQPLHSPLFTLCCVSITPI